MISIYFDTETTGTKESQICQLAYIIDNGVEIWGKNYFFSVKDMDDHAYRIHGFSIEDLDELSQGKGFHDCFEEIDNDFKSASVIIAHNVSFDIAMMSREYQRIGQVFEYHNHLCTMRAMTEYLKLPKTYGRGFKLPSLKEFVGYYIVDNYYINQFVIDIFGVNSRYHDARFDVTSMFLALRQAMNEQDELKEKLCNLA